QRDGRRARHARPGRTLREGHSARRPRAPAQAVRSLPGTETMMSMRTPLLAAFLVAATTTAFASEAAFVVHAGKVIDVDAGKVLADQAIRVENGRIARIAPWSAAEARNAKVVDWTRYTVLPGLMDMHTHVADEGQSADPGAPLKST